MDTIIKDIAGIGSGSSPAPDYSGITGNADKNAQDIIDNQNSGNQAIQDNADQNADKITDKLEETKTGIISGLLDGLKGLFIPDAEYFTGLFNELNEFFSQKFGFLYTPIELLFNLLDVFMSASTDNAKLVFPGFTIMGQTVWTDIEFDLGAFIKQNFPVLQSALFFGSDMLLLFAFLDLLYAKYMEVFHPS